MDLEGRYVAAFLFACMLLFIVGLPGALYTIHGLALWPDSATNFLSYWWSAWRNLDVVTLAQIYWAVGTGQSEVFLNDGAVILARLSILTMGLAVAFGWSAPAANRNVLDGQLGNARFANDKELAAAKRGIEIGLSPRKRKPVRLSLEGNAISFAPPRTGKTTGLIVPNLVGSQSGSWHGPAVVIDPKGEIYRMTHARRRELGRKVICLDPYGLAGGEDCWNPFDGIKPGQASALSRMIGAMLVETGENNQYFRQRATAAIRGAIVALSIKKGKTTPEDVRDLFLDRADLVDAVADSQNSSVRALRDILEMDEKSSAPILSTAQTAFDWLQDTVMLDGSSSSTFTMEEVARGHADLFIVAPTDDAEILAPWLRLVIGELFAAARRRRQPGDERVVVFVDEAAVLRRFGHFIGALGELPGYGMSLWSFWQARGQIEEHYGRAGLDTFLGTAEITTVSGVNPALVTEASDWSAAVGSQTQSVETVST
jgi:type IV secretion system protein VirD4